MESSSAPSRPAEWIRSERQRSDLHHSSHQRCSAQATYGVHRRRGRVRGNLDAAWSEPLIECVPSSHNNNQEEQ